MKEILIQTLPAALAALAGYVAGRRIRASKTRATLISLKKGTKKGKKKGKGC